MRSPPFATATASSRRWSRDARAVATSFYGFIAIEGLTDSIAFAKELLATARVGVAPGMAFGTPGDPEIEKHIRICFAQDPKRLETALGRIGDALRTI